MSGEFAAGHGQEQLGQYLTDVGDDFTRTLMSFEQRDEVYPISVDHRLGLAYVEAFSRIPGKEVEKPVVMVVGNGSFETAAQLFPEDATVIMCDNNPATLFLQRAILEVMRNSETRDEFEPTLYQTSSSLVGWLRERVRGGYAAQYSNLDVYYRHQAMNWEKGMASDEAAEAHPKHFLASDEAYSRARAGMLEHSFAFRLIDFRSQDQVGRLAGELLQSGAEVVCANVTNVFSGSWAGPESAEYFLRTIPFATREAARIIASHDTLLGKALTLPEWNEWVQRRLAER